MFVNHKPFIKTVIFLGIILPGSVLAEELVAERLTTFDQTEFSVDNDVILIDYDFNDLIFKDPPKTPEQKCLDNAKAKFEQCKKDFANNPLRTVCAPEFKVDQDYCKSRFGTK